MRVGGWVRHRKFKPPLGYRYGLWAKVAATVVVGICFVVFASTYSTPSPSTQRGSFSDISQLPDRPHQHHHHTPPSPSANATTHGPDHTAIVKPPDSDADKHGNDGAEAEIQDGGEEEELDAKGDKEEEAEKEEEEEEVSDRAGGDEDDLKKEASLGTGELPQAENGAKPTTKVKSGGGALFELGKHYSWKLCSVRTGHNYVPCLDIESSPGKKLQRLRHHERSCPKTPPMCLVSLPDGYTTPIKWPDCKSKIIYKNVAHPKLSAFIKSRTWLNKSDELLVFPHSQSEIEGGASHYVDSIEEMVPNIEWGKNIRVVLDIGITDSSFNAALLDKRVLTLSMGLKDDDADLAQVALERGFPAMIGILGTRRLPFPGGVFDAIHCGGCNIPWHLNGGKHLLEMNRVLRPGGYFILSTERDDVEIEEMGKLAASICWNILADRTDEISDIGVKIYQTPSSNEIYQLRRKKVPPLCKEDENPDAAWYSPILTCLHTVPAAAEERGSEWPEDWPQRLENFPEWLSDREVLVRDTEHWRAIVNNSYLNGLGLDWSNIRNIMDMKAIYGGFAAALEGHNVWVMNVVPAHAPNTLPIIYDRGLLGSYHDWCESFSTYPRTYDLLHADHLFSRLKNRCKRPVGIVVEMDRILRPGGWVIIRDKVVILNPVEEILKSLHWEIRATYAQGKEGIICAQKTTWRPRVSFSVDTGLNQVEFNFKMGSTTCLSAYLRQQDDPEIAKCSA